jgi:hypothetical protein
VRFKLLLTNLRIDRTFTKFLKFGSEAIVFNQMQYIIAKCKQLPNAFSLGQLIQIHWVLLYLTQLFKLFYPCVFQKWLKHERRYLSILIIFVVLFSNFMLSVLL